MLKHNFHKKVKVWHSYKYKNEHVKYFNQGDVINHSKEKWKEHSFIRSKRILKWTANEKKKKTLVFPQDVRENIWTSTRWNRMAIHLTES